MADTPLPLFRSAALALIPGIALLVSGCMPWTARKYSTVETLASKKDDQGGVSSSIVKSHRFTTMASLFTPDGPGLATVSIHDEFLLKDANGKTTKLAFLHEDLTSRYYRWEFLPVKDSRLWIGTRGDQRKSGHGHDFCSTVVFDENGILHERTFDILWTGRIHSEDGNHTLIFDTKEGTERYHVLEDTVAVIKIENADEIIPVGMGPRAADIVQILALYADLTGAKLDVEEEVRQTGKRIRLPSGYPAMTRAEAIDLIDKALLEAGVVVTHPDMKHVVFRSRR